MNLGILKWVGLGMLVGMFLPSPIATTFEGFLISRLLLGFFGIELILVGISEEGRDKP